MATREQRIKDANAKLVAKLNDLNSRVSTIVEISQAAYDALSPPNPNIIYLITS